MQCIFEEYLIARGVRLVQPIIKALDNASAECYTVLSPYLGHIKCDVPLESESKVLYPSYFMFYVQKWPEIVILYCSISISTNEMSAFGVNSVT